MSKQNKLMRTISIALVAILVLSSAPVSALSGISIPASSSFFASAAGEEIVWTVATEEMLEIEGNTITGYTYKLSGNIEIPTHINGTAITEIAASAFEDCNVLFAIKIPETIIEIGYSAFKNTGLETVYFNASKCKMGIYNDQIFDTNNNVYAAFTQNNYLTKFVFGEKVSVIPANVCTYANNLRTVIFEGKVTEIGNYAFSNCTSLEAIDISNVTTIGYNAFYNCTALKITDENQANTNDNGTIIFSEDLLIIGAGAFENCMSIQTVIIPESVTMIGYSAFKNTGLETVYFNASKCKMGIYNDQIFDTNNNVYAAFTQNNYLTKFVFGEKVSVIPANVCTYANNLQTVYFEGKVTEIGNYAFHKCTSLSDVWYNAGSEADWNKVTIAADNDILSSDQVTVHYGVVSKDNTEFGVGVTYTNKCFDDEEVELKVEETEGERTPGAVYLSDGEIKTQVGCFEIKMVSGDGTIAQPNAGYKVTVKMAIPAEYAGKKNFRIVHRLSNGDKDNFSTSPKGNELKLTVSGNYLVFEVSSFSEFEVSTFEKIDATVKIKNNSKNRTINYGETLKLTAIAEKTDNLPEDIKICWYVDDVLMGEGETFEFSKESGTAEITVKLVDSEDNALINANDEEIADSQTVTVKAGFFQKLISFFKNLFGISRIIEQAFGFKLVTE